MGASNAPTQEHVLMEQNCKSALNDLKKENYFQPIGDKKGPYTLTLSVEVGKLIFHTKNKKGKDLPILILSLSPYHSLVKDYFMIVHSHHEAVQEGLPHRIEAIDMGRRGLHNEGSSLLMERLNDKIEMDMTTARHLFTLICALHRSKIRILP